LQTWDALRHRKVHTTASVVPLSPISFFSSVLAFISTTGRGFQVKYPSITLHAISRTESGPSIYCQLDETPTRDQAENDEDDSPMRELKIVPGRVEARTFSLTSARPDYPEGLSAHFHSRANIRVDVRLCSFTPRPRGRCRRKR